MSYRFSYSSVVINEIMAANDSTLADEDGDYSDWIELFNGDSFTVNLTGYTITDDLAQPGKWVLPNISIAPGEFLLIWCSGKNKTTPQLHTSFKLSREGEFIGLFSPTGLVVDTISFGEMEGDISLGRLPDGANSWVLFTNPTPGVSNGSEISEPVVVLPEAVPIAGFYSGAQLVALSCATEGAIIYYTLDSSDPDTTDILYQNPIQIEATTILRARAYRDGMQPSKIMTCSYFINEPMSVGLLPVLSLVTDPPNLWDPQIGIYENATERGDEWERPVSMEYFLKGGKFEIQVNAGIRIHGGASRKKSQKHSFRLYFRSKYGPAKLDYPIIPGSRLKSFDEFILRAGYNDSWTHRTSGQRKAATYIRDEFNRCLFRKVNQPASIGDYVHVYLNGLYWGIFNIVERYNDDFFDTYVEKGNWDIVKPGPDENKNAIEATEGDLVKWNEFVSWFNLLDFSKTENWNALMDRIDFQNFIDFYVINVWIQNVDWPRHNWYAARNRDRENAKWIFLPWDTESSLGGGGGANRININILERIAKTTAHPLSKLFHKLESSPKFAQAVFNRLEELRGILLNVDSLNAILDRQKAMASPGITLEGTRWGQLYAPEYTYGMTEWEAALDFMRTFFEQRDKYLDEHLKVLEQAQESSDSTAISYVLLNNYPNPFNRETVIEYNLLYNSGVDLQIFDMNGCVIKTFYKNAFQKKGTYQVIWDGTNDQGERVSSGIYVLKIKSGSFEKSHKLVFIK